MDWFVLTVNQRVLLGTSLLGCVAGVVGSLAVLRRRSLMGDMVAHAAMPGLCLAFLVAWGLGVSRDSGAYFLLMMAGATLTGLLGSALVTFVCRWTRTKEDAAIGIVLSTFFGAYIVLISYITTLPGAQVAGLDHYIFGQAAALLNEDVLLIGGMLVLSFTLLVIFYKELKVSIFDSEFSRSQGWPTLMIDLGVMAGLCLVTVAGLPVVGILMAGMIIIPCAAARFWTNRFGPLLIASGVIGAVTGLVATVVSAGFLTEWFGADPLHFGYNHRQLPTGPVIILSGTAIFLFSVVFAPRRGVLARALTAWRLRAKTARQNLLRTLYELSEAQLPNRPGFSAAVLKEHRAWRRGELRWLLGSMTARGLIQQQAGGVCLTESGLARAVEVTRMHRLWELFLIQGASIAPDHVDRDADAFEHFMTPELVEQLESELADVGRLPSKRGVVPESPHDLLAT